MLAIIGGSGLETLENVNEVQAHRVETPYGLPSNDIIEAQIGDQNESFFFLSRHGESHSIAPHLINYRANIHALKSLGVTRIIAVAAVGGITEQCAPTCLVIPDQIIDYTWGREHTFVDHTTAVNHIDFSYPYTESLRKSLLEAAEKTGIKVVDGGIYGATQGPRLETAAEIKRCAQDGCDLIGMTGMPEAALAREAEIEYACLAVIANWCAGILEEEISLEEIYKNLEVGMVKTTRLIRFFIR